MIIPTVYAHQYKLIKIEKSWSSRVALCYLSLSVIQSSADAPYIARHVGLRCGVPIPVPALTVNRLCGSGFQSIINGAQVRAQTNAKRPSRLLTWGADRCVLCCRKSALKSQRWFCAEARRAWAKRLTPSGTSASGPSLEWIWR